MSESPLALLDHLSVGIIQTDLDGITVYVNSAAEQFFEVSRQRLIGRSVYSWMIEASNASYDDSESLSLEQMIAVVLKQQQPVVRRESTFTVLDTPKRADYSVGTITNSINNHVLALVIELNPLKRLNQISHEKQLAEQRKLAQMMIRGIAHELKNPLGGIQGAAQLLARQIDPKLLEYTQVIEKEANRLKGLVEPMLGNQQLNKEWLNIHEPIEHVLRLLRNQVIQVTKVADSSHVLQLKRDYDLSLPEVFADRNQLVQVILNICINAKQAIEESTLTKDAEYKPCICIKTRVERCMTILGVQHRQVLRVNIIDNGPGIPRQMLDTLFFPMMTGRAEGTGLGLSIAQDIIQYHGGLITCQSTVGNTVFSIYLPWGSTASGS